MYVAILVCASIMEVDNSWTREVNIILLASSILSFLVLEKKFSSYHIIWKQYFLKYCFNIQNFRKWIN